MKWILYYLKEGEYFAIMYLDQSLREVMHIDPEYDVIYVNEYLTPDFQTSIEMYCKAHGLEIPAMNLKPKL